jgi:hypothetical protein
MTHRLSQVSVGLNEESKEFQALALDFANSEMKEQAAEWDESSTLPVWNCSLAQSLRMARKGRRGSASIRD